jgi:hypothetical protein
MRRPAKATLKPFGSCQDRQDKNKIERADDCPDLENLEGSSDNDLAGKGQLGN